MNRISPKKLLLSKWTAVQPIAKQMFDYYSEPYQASMRLSFGSDFAYNVAPSLRALDGPDFSTTVSFANAANVSTFNNFDAKIGQMVKGDNKRINYYVPLFPKAFTDHQWLQFKQTALLWSSQLSVPLVVEKYKTDSNALANIKNCVIPNATEFRVHGHQAVFLYLLHRFQNQNLLAPSPDPTITNENMEMFQAASVNMLHLLANTQTQSSVYYFLQGWDKQSIMPALRNAKPHPFWRPPTINDEAKQTIENFKTVIAATGYFQGIIVQQLDTFTDQFIAVPQSYRNILNTLSFADHMPFQSHGPILAFMFAEPFPDSFATVPAKFLAQRFLPVMKSLFDERATSLFDFYESLWTKQVYPGHSIHGGHLSGYYSYRVDKLDYVRDSALELIKQSRKILYPMTEHKLLSRLDDSRDQYSHRFSVLIQDMFKTNQAFFWGNLLSSFFDLVLGNGGREDIRKLLELARAPLRISEQDMSAFFDYVYLIVFLAPLENQQQVIKFNEFSELITKHFEELTTSRVLQHKNVLLPSW